MARQAEINISCSYVYIVSPYYYNTLSIISFNFEMVILFICLTSIYSLDNSIAHYVVSPSRYSLLAVSSTDANPYVFAICLLNNSSD
jgi:hypothetical protein